MSSDTSVAGKIEFPAVTTKTINSLGKDRLKYLFDLLRDTWENDTLLESSVTKIIDHPCYQTIIAKGLIMVPFILDDLREEFNYWSHALHVLTSYEPPKADQTDSEKLRAAWLRWADSNPEVLDDQYGAMDADQVWMRR